MIVKVCKKYNKCGETVVDQNEETPQEWLTYNQLLTKKTSDALDKYTRLYDAEYINKREYFLLVSVLYDTTIGMIDMEVSDLLAEIHKELTGK